MLQRVYQQLKSIYHYIQAHFWRAVYGFPDHNLTIVGITGTNGKTTTCYLLASIFAAAFGPRHVGMLSTVAFRIGEKEIMNETKMTTLPSRRAFQYLHQMRRAGVTHVVLEMTSHALDQHRLAGIRLAAAGITNIAREHLDYHGTMAAYACAKGKIIRYLKPKAPLVVNGDDEWIQRILSDLQLTTYNLQLITFTTQQAQAVTTPLTGDVNKENALLAMLLARSLAIPEEKIQQGIDNLTHVPGRLERVVLPSGTEAIIDYAVTPDALRRLYSSIRQHTTGKIFAILGAAGRRDRGKRPAMAQAVARYADELVITREDPWTENEEQIFEDLEKGLTPPNLPLSGEEKQHPLDKGGTGGCKWQRIVDRREAIRYCLKHAKPGDVIVATGKGAETGMGIGKKIVPWNEKEIILELAQENVKRKAKNEK